jgi:hypothetical protein
MGRDIIDRSNDEMVAKYMLIFLFSFVCFSCGLLFQTPFPDELILMRDSVSLEEELGNFYDSHIHVFNNYVFLTVREKDGADRCIIFTKELEQVASIHDGKYNTFGLIDAYLLRYVIGNKIFDQSDWLNYLPLPDLSTSGVPYDADNPSNWGFSDGANNFYLWWDDENEIAYLSYDSSWYPYGSPPSISYFSGVPGSTRLEHLAFDQYTDPDPMVFLFFQSKDDWPHTVYIYTLLMKSFSPENNGDTFPIQDYIRNQIEIHDVDVEEFFYTREGFILKEYEGSYLRISFEGKEVDRIYSIMSDVSEAYDIDGDNRYIFSHTYKRLARTPPWW